MFATLIALALAAQPAAPFVAPDLEGLWEGNVGTLPVRACFAEEGRFGAYFYLSRLRLIGLDAVEGTDGAFTERVGEGAGPGARWQIERAVGGQLSARWSSGGRTLAVQLHRVGRGAEDENACVSMAFHQPRLAGVRTVSTRATADRTSYTKLTLDHGGHFPSVSVATFALDGGSAPVRRINEALAEPLRHEPPEWLDCVRGTLGMAAVEGDYNRSLEPVMISRRWLSVAEHHDGFCGGAHPDAGNSYQIWDRTTGREINLHDWFTARAVKRETVGGEVLRSLEPAFRTFIMAGARYRGDQAECRDVVRDSEFWNIGLTRTGFVFSPDLPHVVQACGDELTVTFARIRPWLTPAGQAAVAALRAEQPGS